ncbi:Uma2 family endonuclease [Streptomyces acidicola]|uniref:Uma2 family endonuclease n=1 Tax=Streptomyces acidicola TaxID=2596892 RepID=UPI001883C876|nr:Uma2 family endonuclease [Streptomyces acidicola]
MRKPHGYARAGIPVHLLIDREEGEVTVYAEPSGDAYAQGPKYKLGLAVPLPAPLGFDLDGGILSGAHGAHGARSRRGPRRSVSAAVVRESRRPCRVRRGDQGRHREQRGGEGSGMAGEQVSEHGNLAAVWSAAH